MWWVSKKGLAIYTKACTFLNQYWVNRNCFVFWIINHIIRYKTFIIFPTILKPLHNNPVSYKTLLLKITCLVPDTVLFSFIRLTSWISRMAQERILKDVIGDRRNCKLILLGTYGLSHKVKGIGRRELVNYVKVNERL